MNSTPLQLVNHHLSWCLLTSQIIMATPIDYVYSKVNSILRFLFTRLLQNVERDQLVTYILFYLFLTSYCCSVWDLYTIKYLFSNLRWFSIELGCIHSLGSLDYWTGILDWTTGLSYFPFGHISVFILEGAHIFKTNQ